MADILSTFRKLAKEADARIAADLRAENDRLTREIAALREENERLRAAAQLGLDMARANDLPITAETISAALEARP